MLHERLEELIRERVSRGSALEELATLQLLSSLTGQQSMDINSILPAMLLAGGGDGLRGPSGRMAMIALMMMSSQQNQQAAGTVMPGMAPPTTNNMLPLLLALGLFEGRPGPFRFPREDREEDRERFREEARDRYREEAREDREDRERERSEEPAEPRGRHSRPRPAEEKAR